MALIQSLTSRRFRTRAPGRDAATDRQRMDAIRASVTGAIDSAARERAGLKQRVDDHFALASHILDNSDYEQRSQKQESEVLEAERQGQLGLNRLARIDAELERYRQLLILVDSFLDEGEQPGDAA